MRFLKRIEIKSFLIRRLRRRFRILIFNPSFQDSIRADLQSVADTAMSRRGILLKPETEIFDKLKMLTMGK